MIKPLMVTLALLLCPPALADVVGVARVIDGDTLDVDGQRIRLFGIDAPEGKQTCGRDGMSWLCGQEAGKFLRELVGDLTVICNERDRDRYGRTVAVCVIPNGGDLGAAMVAAGLALAYLRYGGKVYDQMEGEARGAKRGLWADGVTFTAPRKWRARKPTGRAQP